MKYAIYRTQTRQLIRLNSLLGHKTPKSNLAASMKLLDQVQMAVYCASSGLPPETLLSDTLGRVLLQEGLWLSKDHRRTIFLDSPQLVENLLRARFACEALTCPDKPVRFSLALPDQMTHQGVPLQPLLITIGRSRDLVDEHAQAFRQRWGSEVEAGTDFPDQLAIMLSTRALETAFSDPHAQGCDHPHLSLFLAGPEITRLLQADIGGPVDGLLPLLPTAMLDALSPTEQKMQILLARLAMSFWIYWQANPGAIAEGTPGRVQDGDAPMLGKALEMMASNTASTTGGRETVEHYRRWHFRQLRDERYYRGEFAGQPLGSRWVFVHDAYVNREAGDDYTAHQR